MKLSSSSSSISYCSSTLLLPISLLCFVLFGTTKALIKIPPNETFPAVLVFGDSIVDTGNNNNLRTIVKCDFRPYGQDFKGGIPTGRFCNGKVPPDFLAQELGIKEVVPAYLDPNLSSSDLPTGVCFASGGSGYDPLTPKLVSVISLSEQLQHFQEYITKLKGLVGEDKTNFILANSIFLVVAGSDDIANTYFTLRVRKALYDVSAYSDLMANSASDFVKQLYALGARRIAVFGAPPIGCVPAQRTLAGGNGRECANDFNQAALLFNKKLSAKLDSIKTKMPNNRAVYIDVYDPLLDLIQNPQQHGFEISDKGCCGTGNIEVAELCNRFTSSVCSNASSYVFWDSYHPTERAYKVLTTSILQKYINAFY
ncbi:GDSL esterase/lipase EXL3-like [Pistacia vera]|uniref:GDSL esterase/lipase EXL3-like n=1 Tax=Pistacia vera TaxID=55513 RepID=UPI001262C2AA|nr:GDSL esterase/lipase EXL3-like [Pistacia vera]XP_031283233.1 GDSL esterase/lipase EXL3-like [Pistacia vera]